VDIRLDASRHRFVREMAARCFVRFHMTLIFGGAVAGGILASRWLFASGVDALAARYALAVLGAYLVFFVLVRGWIVYVTRLAPGDPGGDAPDLVAARGGGRGGSDFAGGGGGRSGGGGASGMWNDGPLPRIEHATPSGGGRLSSAGLDLDDAWLVVLVMLLFVACLGGAALWVVWQAPVILPEAAFEALLAAGLVRAARRAQFGGWARGVLRSTALPFTLVLGAAVLLGWAVQHACPAATRLLDVLTRCP
jgi:hypothetical protein